MSWLLAEFAKNFYKTPLGNIMPTAVEGINPFSSGWCVCCENTTDWMVRLPRIWRLKQCTVCQVIRRKKTVKYHPHFDRVNSIQDVMKRTKLNGGYMTSELT